MRARVAWSVVDYRRNLVSFNQSQLFPQNVVAQLITATYLLLEGQ